MHFTRLFLAAADPQQTILRLPPRTTHVISAMPPYLSILPAIQRSPQSSARFQAVFHTPARRLLRTHSITSPSPPSESSHALLFAVYSRLVPQIPLTAPHLAVLKLLCIQVARIPRSLLCTRRDIGRSIPSVLAIPLYFPLESVSTIGSTAASDLDHTSGQFLSQDELRLIRCSSTYPLSFGAWSSGAPIMATRSSSGTSPEAWRSPRLMPAAKLGHLFALPAASNRSNLARMWTERVGGGKLARAARAKDRVLRTRTIRIASPGVRPGVPMTLPRARAQGGEKWRGLWA
ncbi:hypothetical protein DFH09DRAFT_1368072 [Mycena vulgaris]|nr:hypothetical protein DFH09DRAFT_1368072 [Mycena vulgaris]